MKRIISFVLCLSMLLSMLPVSVFATEVEQTTPVETTPVTEVLQETETAAATEAPETTAETAAETAAAVVETTIPTTVPLETEEEIVEEILTYIPETDLPSNDELFAAYAECAFYCNDICTYGTAAGQTLTGNAKTAYNALVPVIKEIASGQRSSSVISVGYNADVEAQFPDRQFTYDNLVAVLDALLADMPYELYWFDKVSGLETSAASVGGKLRVTFRLFVAGNYSVTGETRTFDLDKAKTGAASAAVTNAQQILDAYRSASDYDKLVGYKKEVCDLTSYNTAAANNMNFSGNDDPWQLIYVFDGLQSTKVVCEGYTKAFQYLCDQTNFQNDITCYQVNGSMKGGTGSGSHMWNIVGINGKNYLADITNSDAGTVGANGKLFLAGGTLAADGSYTVGGIKYIYSQSTLSLWGTGEDSILKLEPTKYNPNVTVLTPSNGSSLTSQELTSALENASGAVSLSCPVAVEGDLVIPEGVYLQLSGSDANITLQEGSNLTVSTFLGISDGANLVTDAGSTLAVNGTLSIGEGSVLDVYGTLEHNAKLECAGIVRVHGTYIAGENAYTTLLASGKVMTEKLGPPTNEQELADALLFGGEVTVWDHITITEDTVLSSESLLSFADFAKLTVKSGATLTLNCPTMINGAQLIVEEGATLINNVDLAINNPQNNGGCAIFDGSFENNGAFWVNTGSQADINGYAFSGGPIFVGFGGSGRLSVNGQLDACAYMAVNEGGEFNLSPGAKLNLLGEGGGYLDNAGKTFLNGDVYIEGLMSSGARRDEETGEVVGADAIIDIRGSVTGTGTSLIAVGEKGSIDCYGPVTTSGEVVVEPNGSFWVDHSVTLAGPVTMGGALHIDYFDEYATADGVLNLEGTANVSGYLAVHDGGTLNVTQAATLNILNNENGCGYLDNHGGAWIHGTLNLDGLCTSGNEAIENGYTEGGAILDITGSLCGSERSSIGVLKGGSMNFNGPGTTDGELIVEQGGVLWVDNVLNLKGSTPFIVNGNVHVNFFDEPGTPTGTLNLEKIPYEEDGAMVDAYAGINGYVNICQGAVMNTSETTLVQILNNENGYGYLDNQGTVNLAGPLYLEGLFTTGAAQDEQGNITGAPATATITGPIDITESATFVVSADGTVTTGDIHNGGELVVEAGSELVISGNFTGNAPINNGGNITENLGDPMERFEALMNSENPVLSFNVKLDRDMEIPEYLTIAEGATLTVPAGVTLTLNGVLDVYGKVIVDGSLANNGMIWVNSDAALNITEGGYSGPIDSFLIQAQMDMDGNCANITGIPMEAQTLCYNVYNDADIRKALACSEESGYGWTILSIAGSFSLNKDLTIPENCFFLMNAPADEHGNVPHVTFTVPENVTVINNGYFEVPENATVVLDGLWFGDLPMVWGGTLSGSYFEMSQEQFEQWLNSGVEDLWLNSQVVLTSNLVIDRGFAIGPNGSITIAEGVNVVLNGDIWIDEGRLIVDGWLENNNYIGITAGEITVNGTYVQAEWARVENFTYDYGYYDQSLQINGIDRGLQTLFFDYDDPSLLSEFLADLDGYRYGTIMIRGDFTLTESIVIPENVYVNIINDTDQTPTLTVPKIHSLINYGEIKIGYDGHLIVDGTFVGNLPILTDDTAEFTVNGTLRFSQDELEAMLDRGGDVNLTVPLVLNRDLTIPGHANLNIGKGGQLIVPGGKTLYVDGNIHVEYSVDKMGNGQPGLLLESGRIVNNGLISVFNLGLFDASNGTYEQAEWGVLDRIYRGDDHDSEIPFLAAEILGIPNGLITIGVDYPNLETIRVVSAIAAWAEQNGEPFREIRYTIERSITLDDDLVIPTNGYLWIGQQFHDPFVTLTVPEGVTLTNHNIIEITANGRLVMEGKLEGYQPWTTGGGEYISSTAYTEADLRADIIKAAEAGTQLFLCRPVTLTKDLTIPEGFCLTIGRGGQLIVPQGVTLTVNGDLQVVESVENDHAPGLLLQGGKLVNNGTIMAEGFGIIDASNGTYEQADWAQVQRIYHDYGNDIHPADILGIPMSSTTLIAAEASEELIRMVLAIADWAEELGDPFSMVCIELNNRELRLTEDLTLSESAWMQVRDFGTLIVPNGVTLTNHGNIDIYWAGTVIVEEGGKIVGNHPSCVDTGAEYINHNSYTQSDLEALIAENLEKGYAVLSVPVTLERSFTVPADFTLIITGRDNFITIPNGVTMYNNGTISCQMFGGILAKGGRLVNDGPIHVLNWGVVDMSGGEYIPWGNGTVYNQHYRWSDGYEEHATVVGFHPFHVVVIAGGDEDSLLHEMIDFINSVSQGGYHSGLSSEIMSDMTLSGDLYWPGFATMTIPEGVTVTIPEGVTLDNWGNIFVYGTLIVEGTLTGHGRIHTDNADRIIGNVDSSITIPGVKLESFTVAVSQETISSGDFAQLWIENATEGAEVHAYRYRLISGDATLFGNEEYFASPNGRVDIYHNWNGNTDPIIVEVTPLVGYDENGDVFAEDLTQTVTIQVVNLTANVWWNAGKWFHDEIYGVGVYAGSKFTLGGFLYNTSNGDWMDGTARLEIQGANEFITLKENADGTVTVSTDKNMTEGVVLTVIAIPEETYGLEAATSSIRISIRPNVNKADLLLNGEAVTGKTVTFDLNRGQEDLWLDFVTDPADASGGIFLDFNQTTGEPIYALSYKSSNEKIATVDQWGNVHFTGATGNVKITATASLSKKVTAAVTFNVVQMPHEIYPAENTVTQLIGGKGASYAVVDENGKAVNAKDVNWFLCDAWGNPIESSPYAAIKNGKLSTKAVIDPYEVYLMAQLVGDEFAARLAEPICVTLYPAVSSVNILNIGGYPITGQTIPWDYTDMAENLEGDYYLSWSAAPCADSIREVTWKSSKPAIADVDANTGRLILTGSSGTVKFTATAVALDGKKVTASVTFQFGAYTRDLELYANLPDGERRALEGADLDGLVIHSGESITFEAYNLPENVTTKGVNWTFADPAGKSFASISSKGVLKAKNVVNPETVIVGVESKDKYCGYAIFVTILPKPVKVGNEMKDALLIENDIGEYITKATVTLTPDTETMLYANEDVSWKSSNNSVATIDDDGRLITLKNGTAKITATADDGRKAEVTIKVGKLAESLKITTKKGEPFTVASGKGLDLAALVTYTDGSTDNKVTWNVSDTGLAKIASSGKLTAAKGLTEANVVEVYAVSKDGQVEASVSVEILPLSIGVEVYGPFHAASSYDVDVSNTTQKWDITTQGNTFYLYAGLFPYDAMQDVTWKSSSTKVATIDESGRVTCLTPGSVTITATAKDGSGKKASFKLAVSKTMAYLTLPETAQVTASKNLTMTKLEGFSMDTLASNKTLTWSLTDLNGNAVSKNVATLDAKGVLKANKAVTSPVEVLVRAEATDGSGLWAECVVTILPK